MSTVNRPQAKPAFAVTALAMALLVAFPQVYAEPSPPSEVSARGHERVKLQHGEDYARLTASHGGKISGAYVDVEGHGSELVKASSGGKITLKGADIKAGAGSHHGHGATGPAVSAVGDDGHGRRHGHHDRHDRTEISLKNGSVTTYRDRSAAVSASGRGAVVDVDGTRLKTYGKGSDVAQASAGGTLRLEDAEIDSYGKDADGVSVRGRKSSASLYKVDVDTRGTGANGATVRDGGQLNVRRSSIETRGASAVGLEADGRDTRASVSDSRVETKGKHADAVRVRGGADVSVERSRIATKGTGSAGIDAAGRGTDVRVAHTEIRTSGRDAAGIELDDHASAKIERSVVKTSGQDSTGIALDDGASAKIERSFIKTSGKDSAGIALDDRANAKIDRSVVKTSGQGSAGIELSDDASARIADSSIETTGKYAAGVAVDDSRVYLHDTRIQTSGRQSNGLEVEGDDALAKGSHVQIATSGSGSRAVSVEDGAKVVLSDSAAGSTGEGGVAVSVRGDGSRATLRDGEFLATGSKGKALDIRAGGTVWLDDSLAMGQQTGASVKGEDSLLVATGSQIVAAQPYTVMAYGHGGHGGSSRQTGLDVSDGGRALLIDSSVQAQGQDGTGAKVEGRGSALITLDTEITAEGDGGVGLKVDDGGFALVAASQVTGDAAGISVGSHGTVVTLGGEVSATGDEAKALRVRGHDATAVALGTDFAADGYEGIGVAVERGGSALLVGSSISAQGTGLSAQGRGSKAIAVGTTIQSGSASNPYARDVASPATGVLAADGGTVALIGGKVSVAGDGGVAAKSDNGTLVLGGVRVKASGDNSHAVVAESSGRDGRHRRGHGHDSNEAIALVTHSKISTSGKDSDAVVAQGRNSGVLVDHSSITTTGKSSAGVSAQDGGQIVLEDSKVKVSGKGSAAAQVGSTLGHHQRAVSSLEIVSSTLVASGKKSAGIVIENSGDVTIKDSTVRATGASLVSRLDAAGQRQNIVLGDGATLVKNNGILLQVDRSGHGGDGQVHLDLQDGSVTRGNIIDGQQVALEGEGGTYVRLGALASYDGLMFGVKDVVTEGGNQTLNFEGGSTMASLKITQNAVTSGGTIDNQINVSGDVLVDGATLGGNWNINGTLTSQNGGIIRPGNSVGVVNADSISWGAGTIYEVEVNEAGQSDVTHVTSVDPDAAYIGDTTLVVKPENGEGHFLLKHDYEILTAEGGVTGQFLDASWEGTPYPLIKMDTLYSKNAVAVRMGVDRDAIENYGFTPNQRAAALGAESVTGVNATADAAFFSTDPAPVFDQLSGEVHASVRSTLFNDMIITSAAMQRRMRANLGAGQVAGKAMAALDGATASAMPRSAASPLWVSFSAGETTMDGDGNAASTRYSSNRILVGGDAAVGKGWRLGAAAGAGTGNLTVKDRGSDGSIDNYTVMLYGGNGWDMGAGKLKLLLGGGYTRHDIDTNRSIDVGGPQSLDASYHGSTWQVFGDLGYAMPLGENFSVEPYANVTWFKQRLDGFSESGGDAALESSSTKATLGTYTLGLRTALVFPGKTNTFTLRGTLGWRHATGDQDPSRTMSFIEGAGSSFSVLGAPIAKNVAVVGIGGELGLGENVAMGLSYDGQFGSGNTDNSGSLFLKVRF